MPSPGGLLACLPDPKCPWTNTWLGCCPALKSAFGQPHPIPRQLHQRIPACLLGWEGSPRVYQRQAKTVVTDPGKASWPPVDLHRLLGSCAVIGVPLVLVFAKPSFITREEVGLLRGAAQFTPRPPPSPCQGGQLLPLPPNNCTRLPSAAGTGHCLVLETAWEGISSWSALGRDGKSPLCLA